ncbi:MAG: M23 family metallopeptidase [Saprospiraceae bacterium]
MRKLDQYGWVAAQFDLGLMKNWMRWSLGFLLLLPSTPLREAWPDFTPQPPERLEDLYPKDYFQSPIDAEIHLAGTFGELRSNHFHSGLDMKSQNGYSGETVRAAADGYIYQIKVLESGYGNVLYLKHPNGYTTVYAHLQEFSKEVADYVKEQQYKKERFQVVLSVGPSMFPVKKGQAIGKMGNSGSSHGPHLHFEIRNTASQKALNPQLFGLPIKDSTHPDIRDMKWYVLNSEREVIGEQALPIVRKAPGEYGIVGDTLLASAWRVGFGVKVYDRMDLTKNDNGIRSLTLDENGKRAYNWQIDELSFAETRYLNAHTDYGAHDRYGAWFHRCFILPGNRLSSYKWTESKGMIEPHSDKASEILLTATDAAGNKSQVRFWVKLQKPVESVVSPAYNYKFPKDAQKEVALGDFYMSMPAGALYEDLLFTYGIDTERPSDVYSSVHQVHQTATPVHKRFELRIAPTNLPENMRNKAVIARIESGRPVNCGGEWKGEMLSTKVRDFGNYAVMVDNTPPSITPVVFDRDMRRKSSMSFRIKDDFAIDGRARGLRYRGTIDGKWVLFEFDKKRNRLTYTFDEHVGTGEHTLRLVVNDDRGNEQVYEREFVR